MLFLDAAKYAASVGGVVIGKGDCVEIGYWCIFALGAYSHDKINSSVGGNDVGAYHRICFQIVGLGFADVHSGFGHCA